ncbi:MAG: hypothetical protein ACJAT2_002182 [Bacteriovoracaceae bacterium]
MYPNNKKEKMIKIHKVKGIPYISMVEKKNEISRLISEPLYQQIRKNFIRIVNNKKPLEFACPSRIRMSIQFNDKRVNYCKSTKLKRSVAKLFNRLNQVVKR